MNMNMDMDMDIVDSIADFFNACEDTANLINFRDQIYPKINKILPHTRFACGALSTDDLHVADFINITFPSNYLDKIKKTSCPVMLRWLALKSPTHIDTSTLSFQSSSESWFNYFKQHNIKTLTVHGVLSINKKTIYFFVFGGVNDWTDYEIFMLKLLVPQLYCMFTDLNDAFNSHINSKKILTPREEQVLKLICKGNSNAEVARTLYISSWTVKVHVSNVIAKLKASNRSHAVAKAIGLGLLTS